MVDTAQPLNSRFPITNPDGTPSEYFIRWAQQFSRNTAAATDVVYTTRQVNTGFGLSGGGDLSADRTLSLGNPALSDPGADRGVFWDDSAGELAWLEFGTGLTLTDDVLTATGGGGGAPWWFDPPTAAELSTIFSPSGSPVVTDDDDIGLIIRSNNAGVGSIDTRVATKALPAGDFIITARISGDMRPANGDGAGLVLVETGTNKIASIGFLFDTNLAVDPWNGTLNTFTSRGTRIYHSDIANACGFFRIERSGSDYIFSYSATGKGFIPLRTAAATSLFTTAATHVGVGNVVLSSAANASLVQAACDHWAQNW